MVAVALVLWVGVPFGWLWVGSQVQAATDSDSVGLPLLTMFVGVVLSIWAIVRLLGWLNLQHMHARERKGLETYGNVTLEGIMAYSAFLALGSFCIWFFLFSGSSPVPINISY